MKKVAVLSRWHVHADDYAREIKENEHLSIGLVWDEDKERGEKWAEELGVPFEQDLQAVLANPSIDAVVVNTPTNLHKEIIIAAANHKKHIFTEKVLAFTVADCEDIYTAVEANGVHLMVSLPRLTAGYYVYAQKALDNGSLGNLTMIRCRLAHNGAVAGKGQTDGWLPTRFFDKEKSGGGAFIDLGAHPIYLTNRLAGPAHSLHANLKQVKGMEVDDNAVAMVEYESGALGVIETGFLSSGSPFQLELYGTEGTLLIEDEEIRLKSSQHGGGEWVQPKAPECLPMPMEQWSMLMRDEAKPTITKEDVIQLTRMNEAAVISHASGCKVELKEM